MESPSYHVVRMLVAVREADRVQGELYDHGCLGLEETDGAERLILKAYFEGSVSLNRLLENLSRSLPSVDIQEATTIGLGDTLFQPAPFEPFSLVGPMRVVPPPELVAADRRENLSPHDILLMPGLAFGSGRHETTRLVARALWHLNPLPSSVLDVGTGSGILAILASKTRIPRVDAVEISREARENARGNFERNACAGIRLFEDLKDVRDAYDAILCNLLTPTILHLKRDLARHLAPRGRLILSGVTVYEADEVEREFRDFRLLQRNDTEDWACLTLERPD